MEGVLLRFYVEEGERHQGVLLWEWLLEKARSAGVGGGSAFRAVGGFGRHRLMHEDGFFEQAGKLVVAVEFIVPDKEAIRFLDIVQAERLRVFYARVPATFGVVNPDRDDPPEVHA